MSNFNFTTSSSTSSGFSGSTFTPPPGIGAVTSQTMPSTLGGPNGNILASVPSSASSVGSSVLGTSNPLGSLFSSSSTGTTGNATDFRVRIRPQPAAQAQILGPGSGTSGSSNSALNSLTSSVLGSVGSSVLSGVSSLLSSSSTSSLMSSVLGGTSSNILNILYDTNGMMFPYTPTIEWHQQVRYEELSYVHSNQDYYAYKNTPSTELTISGALTLQNQREGEYMIACMHFLRTVSKMYFGQAAAGSSTSPGNAGMPPPVLLLSGYGDFMFNDLPVIVLDHSYTLGNDVDYVTIQVAGGKVRLPSILNITVHLVVQHTAQDMRTKFDLDKFRTGQLMKSKGWI